VEDVIERLSILMKHLKLKHYRNGTMQIVLFVANVPLLLMIMNHMFPLKDKLIANEIMPWFFNDNNNHPTQIHPWKHVLHARNQLMMERLHMHLELLFMNDI
jgi:hypothetical protein